MESIKLLLSYFFVKKYRYVKNVFKDIYFFVKKYNHVKNLRKVGKNMTQQELRELYIKRMEREKQTYISKQTQINSSILSKFKKGKIDLYPYLFERLEKYLTEGN